MVDLERHEVALVHADERRAGGQRRPRARARRGSRPARRGRARRRARGGRPARRRSSAAAISSTQSAPMSRASTTSKGETVKSLRRTGSEHAARAAWRSATEPPKNSTSVSTDRHDAPPASYVAGHRRRVEVGVEVALRRRAALDLADDREVRRPPASAARKPARRRQIARLRDQIVERPRLGRRHLAVTLEDAVEVGGHQKPSLAAIADGQLVDRHAHLLGGVAIADRDGTVLERVEVDRDAQRRADLVLTAVALADRLRLVVVDHVAVGQRGVDLAGQRRQRVLLAQRQHRHLVRREARVQAQHGARLVVDDVLVVRGQQERGHRAVDAGGGLDDVRHVALVGGLVEVVELLAAVLACCLRS